MSFFSFAKKQNVTQVIEIRDTFISSSVVVFEKGSKPKVLFCDNIKIANTDFSDSQKHMDKMLETLLDTIQSTKVKLVKIGNHRNIDAYQIFLSPLWCISVTNSIKNKKDVPFLIDSNFVEKILEQNESENDSADLIILEKKIVESKVNGYKVQSLIGSKGTEVEIEIFTSYIARSLKNRIAKMFEDIRRRKDYTLTSNALSSYSFFRDLYMDKNDFMYFDIGELITEISLVRDDSLFGTVSLPIGKNTILKNISKRFKLPHNLSISKINLASQGSQNTSPEEKKVLSDQVSIVLNAADTAITKICNPIDLPKNIFILRNDDFANVIIREIDKVKNLQILQSFNHTMAIIPIDEGILNTYITNGKVFKNYPHVKIDVLFVNKIFHNQS